MEREEFIAVAGSSDGPTDLRPDVKTGADAAAGWAALAAQG